MSEQTGILASRADHHSSTYFCFANKSANLSQSDFSKWFKALGYTISCYNQVIDGEAPAVNIDILKNCK